MRSSRARARALSFSTLRPTLKVSADADDQSLSRAMPITLTSDLRCWFVAKLDGLRIPDDVKPYVVDVLSQRGHQLASSSIVLAYARATSFSELQAIGDFVLWKRSVMGSSVDETVMMMCAKSAYAKCYESTFGRAKVYERMADELESISSELHDRLFQRYLLRSKRNSHQ